VVAILCVDKVIEYSLALPRFEGLNAKKHNLLVLVDGALAICSVVSNCSCSKPVPPEFYLHAVGVGDK
jgi:hypothetical protein